MARSFQQALRDGQNAERNWVDELRHLGLSVAHGRKIVVKHHDPRSGHVEAPDALGLFSVEIKERSLSFNSPEDYPYETVFVDDCRGLSKEPFRNLIYVYVSRPTGKWVWLTVLDKDESWHELVTHDRGRGHDVPVLVAPKAHLRPARELTALLFPHLYLDLVDGHTAMFVSGGGGEEERDRYVAKTNPDFGGRGETPAVKADKRMG